MSSLKYKRNGRLVKRLEILRDFVPQARRIAILIDPTTISTRVQLASVARELGVELLLFEAGNPDQLGPALDSIAAANVAAVNVLASPFLQVSRQEIIRRMHDYRLPAIRMAVDDIDVSNLLGKVSAPSIVFHCTRDNLVPFNQGQQLAAGILNSKFVGLTSANHAMLSDEPAWAVFIKELDTFLESST